MTKSVEIFIDGASRGNPGPSGIGIVFFDDTKKVVKKLYKFIGNTTNNVAEYTAFIYALQEALIDRVDNVTIKSDSELLTRQLRGEYKVKNENLKLLYGQATHLFKGFSKLDIITIGRKDNSIADNLANKAVDSSLNSSLKIE